MFFPHFLCFHYLCSALFLYTFDFPLQSFPCLGGNSSVVLSARAGKTSRRNFGPDGEICKHDYEQYLRDEGVGSAASPSVLILFMYQNYVASNFPPEGVEQVRGIYSLQRFSYFSREASCVSFSLHHVGTVIALSNLVTGVCPPRKQRMKCRRVMSALLDMSLYRLEYE